MSHPGLAEPGPPGGERFLCPLCDWYLDVVPPSWGDPLPTVRNPPAEPGIAGFIRQVLIEAREDLDVAIEAHLVERHTAPVVLDTER